MLAVSIASYGPNNSNFEVDLSSEWQFSIGDDEKWSLPSFDDSGWETLYAPALWDNQGYAGYNGFGWYRKWFFVPKELKGKCLIFQHGGVDDNDWVYINGKKVGEGKGCYKPRQYTIPSEVINFETDNSIAIRIYDGAMGGGLAVGSLRIKLLSLADKIDLAKVSITGEYGKPNEKTVRIEVANKEEKPHKIKLKYELVDYFMRK